MIFCMLESSSFTNTHLYKIFYLLVSHEILKTWGVYGKLHPWPREHFYADPMDTSDELLRVILARNFVAFHGPRASGKTTRIMRVKQVLDEEYSYITC